MVNRKPSYSPSRLATYQACPRKYYFQYVAKLPTRPWANQVFGATLHRSLHALHSAGGPQVQPVQETVAHLDKTWSDAGFATKADAEAARKRGRQLLEDYHDRWADDDGTPIILEKRLTAPYRAIKFLGILDRVDRLGDGSLAIIDYKSGYQPETIGPTTLQQMAIYHHLVRDRLGEIPSVLLVHYLSDNARVPLPLDLADIEDLLFLAYETAERISGDEAWKPVPAEHCQWCDFERTCKRTREQ